MEQLSVMVPMLAALAASLAVPGGGPVPPGGAPAPPTAYVRAAEVADTTVALRTGQTVEVSGFRGRLLVRTWERDAVRIRSEGGDRLPVEVRIRDGRVSLRGARRHGRGPAGAIRLTVPPEVDLEILGEHLDTRVEGTRGRLRISSLHGSIELDRVSGDVGAHTVHGVVEGREVSGTVRLRSVDEDVRVRGAGGEVTLDSVDGDVTAEDVSASSLTAKTVDGDVRFGGRLAEGGAYELTTHDGDLTVMLAEPVSARVTVSTFDGEFQADFPVTLERFRGGREMSFTLGEGGAELVLSAFDGDIRLRRSP